MTTKYEEAQQRVTEKNPCGLTLWQRLKCWFWGTRVGVALNALLGRPTAYRLTIEGCLVVGKNALVCDCVLRPPVDASRVDAHILRTKISNG